MGLIYFFKLGLGLIVQSNQQGKLRGLQLHENKESYLLIVAKVHLKNVCL